MNEIKLYTNIMMNYYDEMIAEIKQNMADGDYAQAFATIKKELSMPYIPEDTEEQLYALLKDLRFQMSEKRNTERSVDDILDGLRGSSECQLVSAAQLAKRNLRDYIEEIQDYLKDDPYPEAAALIVEAIAEQEIQDEFIWNKDGVEYTFYGDSLVPCSHSKGFLKANALLNQWLNKNPDMYEMAKTMLAHDVFMFLPLSYEEDEGQSLAFDILEEITRMMDRNDILEDVKKQIGFVSQQFS